MIDCHRPIVHDRRRASAVAAKTALAVLLPVAILSGTTGCAGRSGVLKVVSYLDPYFPETYSVKLAEGAFRIDSGGDTHLLARASGAEPQPTLEQFVHVHLFWRPKPGKTHDDPSTVDSVIRYVVRSPGGVAVYEGTGFVYARRDRLTGRVSAEIENARLQLHRIDGDVPDILGESRLSGKILARDDGHAAVDLLRSVDLAAGPAAE